MGMFICIAGLVIMGLIEANGKQKHAQDMDGMQDMEMMRQMQQMQNMEAMQQTQTMEDMRRMSDPYENPGMDVVVDESFHGIDHGMGIANPEHNFESMSDGFFGGSNDGFFGGSNDSFFGGSNDSFFGGGCGGGFF